MSSYLLILRRNQSKDLGMAYEEMFTRFRDFTIWLQQSGVLKSFERLKAGTEGKTLRRDAGELALGGPYGTSPGGQATGAGTHEDVIGFYLVEAADEAAAQAIARECPILLVGGSVEIRETEHFPGQ